MSTDVDICNHALGLVGLEPIVSIDPPDATNRARRCAIFYPRLRNQMLRGHDWNFAGDWYQFSAADAAAPPAEFAYRHAMPNTIMRIRYIAPRGNRFEVLRRYLYSDEAAPLAKVTLRIEDAGSFDPMFEHALATLLSANLASALLKDTKTALSFVEQYRALLPVSESIDSMEGDFQESVPGRLESVR